MYAPVDKVFIFRDELSGLSRGYALVEFKSVEDATKIVSTRGYFSVKGLQVSIGYATPNCIRYNCYGVLILVKRIIQSHIKHHHQRMRVLLTLL